MKYQIDVKAVVGFTRNGRRKYGPAFKLGLYPRGWQHLPSPSDLIDLDGRTLRVLATYSVDPEVYKPYKQRKPDVTFNIIISPVFYVHSCPARLAEEAQGYFGFHQWHTCPNCSVVSHGWEGWGENGHRQGGWATREQLAGSLQRMARKQWRMRDGRLMGYRFFAGQPIYYKGN